MHVVAFALNARFAAIDQSAAARDHAYALEP
jgi:hypothetical protein